MNLLQRKNFFSLDWIAVTDKITHQEPKQQGYSMEPLSVIQSGIGAGNGIGKMSTDIELT